jgi:glycogen synthase
VHFVLQAIERGCQFVILGSAPDPKVQAEFDELNNEMGHGQVSTCISHFSNTFQIFKHFLAITGSGAWGFGSLA